MSSLLATVDGVKIPIILFGYLICGPLLGLLVSHWTWGRRLVMAGMVFLTALWPPSFTLSLEVIDGFRGHTRGFEFSIIEILAIALIVGSFIKKPTKFKWLPPGLLLYLVYCLVCLLTVFTTPFDTYLVGMAATKFFKAALIFVAAYHYLRDEGDIRVVIHAIALALYAQLGAALFDRYANGMHRVNGWFEHPNSLAMWTYSLAFPILAVALSRRTRWLESFWLIGAWCAAGVIILLTISRGSVMAFGLGSAAIACGSLLVGFTLKRIIMVIGMGAGAVFMFSAAADTIIHRFTTSGDNDPMHNLRLILNDMSSEMVSDHPMGVGWNNYAIANSRPVPTYSQMLEDWSRNRGHHVNEENYTSNPLTESLYWCILAETGYLGLLTYLLFAAATFWWCWRNIPKQRHSLMGFFLFGLGVALAFNYAHSHLERILTQTKNLSMWLIFLGLIAKVESMRRERTLFSYPLMAAFFRVFGRPARSKPQVEEATDPLPAPATPSTPNPDPSPS